MKDRSKNLGRDLVEERGLQLMYTNPKGTVMNIQEVEDTGGNEQTGKPEDQDM